MPFLILAFFAGDLFLQTFATLPSHWAAMCIVILIVSAALPFTRYKKYLYLPQAYSDSIFAIIAEELGFIGTTIVLSLETITLLALPKCVPTK